MSDTDLSSLNSTRLLELVPIKVNMLFSLHSLLNLLDFDIIPLKIVKFIPMFYIFPFL